MSAILRPLYPFRSDILLQNGCYTHKRPGRRAYRYFNYSHRPTAEEKHERQMAEQEAKLNMAMNAGNVTAWIYELHTQEFMLRGNMRTEKGLNMEKYLGMLHPDDRIIPKELFDTILHGQKESAETVFRYMHEDGTYHYYDSRMISKKKKTL